VSKEQKLWFLFILVLVVVIVCFLLVYIFCHVNGCSGRLLLEEFIYNLKYVGFIPIEPEIGEEENEEEQQQQASASETASNQSNVVDELEQLTYRKMCNMLGRPNTGPARGGLSSTESGENVGKSYWSKLWSSISHTRPSNISVSEGLSGSSKASLESLRW